jgi:hypothetical protein
VISSLVSRLVKNSHDLQASTLAASSACFPLTRRQTLTLPSIPPVATISPSELKAQVMTESVCPVSLTGSKVVLLMGYFEDEGSGKGESGEKMKARSSSPPEIARGGLGKEGCRVTWKIEDSWWTAAYYDA